VDQPYYQAARFATKEQAGAVYFSLQTLIFAAKDDCDLSAYRIHITEGWHVVVVGEQPPEALHVQMEALLTQGTLVSLSTRPDVLEYLHQRRVQATTLAPWVEAHYDHQEEEETPLMSA
jgi:hypothetical protein